MPRETLLTIAFGWSLGCFSPWIAEFIQRPYKRRKLKKSIDIELIDLRRRLASVVYLALSQGGRFNREITQWVQSVMDADKGPADVDCTEVNLRKLLELSGDQLRTLASKGRFDMVKKVEMLKWKTVHARFLASNVEWFGLFSPEFQRLAHEILGGVETFNEEVEILRTYHLKTFDAGIDTNRNLLIANFNQGSGHLAIIAKRIADNIERIRRLSK